MIDEVLLKKVADKLREGRHLMGSKWQNCEAEMIAEQTIVASDANLEAHGTAFSWLNQNALRGRQQCGTDNARGLGQLLDDGSLTQEDFGGSVRPPEGTARDRGMPQVLRVTNNLLHYAASVLKVD